MTEMQEGSSSLLASASACCDSAIMIPDYFIVPSRFVLFGLVKRQNARSGAAEWCEKYSWLLHCYLYTLKLSDIDCGSEIQYCA